MQVKKEDVTSVSGPDGEIVADENGVLTVPTDLGEWLVRVHGFVQHFEAPKAPEAEKPETAAQKKKREAAEAKASKPEAEKPETAADSPEGDSQD